MPEDNRVVELEIAAPDELCAVEIVLEERLLRADLLLGILAGITPGRIIKIDRVPILRNRDRFGARLRSVAADRPPEEFLRLPLRASDRAVTQLEDEAAIADLGVVVFHSGFRVGVVLGHHREGHRIAGQDVDRHHVVWDELNRVRRHQLAVDVKLEPVVGVDVGLDRVLDARLGNLRATAFAFLCHCRC